MTYTTANGSTIEVTQIPTGFDLHLRNAEGESVASVVVPDLAGVREHVGPLEAPAHVRR